jgi:hypothetical protein
MEKIYRFRVILDTEDDVFRDIEINAEDSFEDLHNSIVQAFNMDGMQMASFYESDDEWNQGREYSLFESGDKEARVMNEYKIEMFFEAAHQRMIYVYDFFSMWTFYVELFKVEEPEQGAEYPRLAMDFGEMPKSKEETSMQGEEDDKVQDIFEGFDDFDEQEYGEEDVF